MFLRLFFLLHTRRSIIIGLMLLRQFTSSLLFTLTLVFLMILIMVLSIILLIGLFIIICLLLGFLMHQRRVLQVIQLREIMDREMLISMSKIKVSSALGNVFVTEGMTVTEDVFVLQKDSFGRDALVVDLPTISKDIVAEPTSVTDGEDTSDSA